MRPALRAAILPLACAFAGPVLADCKGLTVEQAWIPEAPPVASVLAGFATLRNSGGRALHIDTVDGDDFGSVELHQMSMEGGMMQMRPLKGLDVPAHGSVTLADGGKHLMLINPKHPFQAGDSSLLNFHCGGEWSQAQFSVKARP
ncbi:MAG: copper chaperone PCu(A)C [Nevskia sp.]|nr:copper chaperone PCu(A)C [Nevskia sp.]